MKAQPGFEWFVAWRHLRDPERGSRRILFIGAVLTLLGGIAWGVAAYLGRKYDSPLSFLQPRPPAYLEYLRLGGIIGFILGLVVSYFGLLRATFTVFTAISIFGVFLGTAAPIVVLSVMSGFEADLKGKIRGAKADIVITRKDGDEKPFTDWARVRATIATVPGVVASTPYIESEVMLNASGTPAGVVLRGIDPESAAAVLDLERTLREGKIADLAHPERVRPSLPRFSAPGEDEPEDAAAGDGHDSNDTTDNDSEEDRVASQRAARNAAVTAQDVRPTIILGEELYGRNLRVFLGNDLMVVCPLCGLGPNGAGPRSRDFRVAGHFYSGMYEFDSKLAYISLQAAQRFLGMPGEVTGIDVRTAAPAQASAIADVVQKTIGADYEVRSWEELNKGLFMALKLEKIAMFIVLTFIALVASFSIISNLIMMVTEKGREVAILKAMGAGDGAILRVFFAEGLYIGLLGLGVGVTVGVVGCQLIEKFGLPLPTDVYYISRLPVVMRLGEILTVAGLALLLCCLATIYPAILASRLKPVEGLRYE
jgi:lipoprotein-releasing system permease protein